MEKHLGRFLRPNEVVHHKNEIRNDNRLCNLEIMTASKHAKMPHLNKRGHPPRVHKKKALKILFEYKKSDINVIPLSKKHKVARTTVLDILHGEGAYSWIKYAIKGRLPTRNKRGKKKMQHGTNN